MTERAIEVADNPDQGRFEITVDGRLAGFTRYQRLSDSEFELYHTEVDPSFEGQGIGSALIRQTLDALAARSLTILPTCPFVRAFLQRHPDYRGLVPEAARARYGL